MSPAGIGREYGPHSLSTYITEFLKLSGQPSLPIGIVDVDPKMVAHSAEITSRVLGRHVDLPNDRYNAEDFRFARLTEWRTIRAPRVLDFGAGYGRRINLWSTAPGIVYCAVDAIENGYCSQSEYFERAAVLPVVDYMDDGFAIAGPGIYHLPAWRPDLLPSGFFDYALCVQVLPELGERTIKHVLDMLHRVLKPGGVLYIRDPDLLHRPPGAHGYDLEAILPEFGFWRELRAYLPDWHPHKDGAAVFGLPRIWRKAEPRVIARPVGT